MPHDGSWGTKKPCRCRLSRRSGSTLLSDNVARPIAAGMPVRSCSARDAARSWRASNDSCVGAIAFGGVQYWLSLITYSLQHATAPAGIEQDFCELDAHRCIVVHSPSSHRQSFFRLALQLDYRCRREDRLPSRHRECHRRP